ncbi:MAG TPA: peptidase U32 family protein [Candidatus Nanoarchaeia archaeon]|nr:peptidase U32 family protein [Candidatus Nanoarchaeia archaeon]
MKPELLAPCHDFSTLGAAIKAGADAVYFGAGLSMRAGANFTVSDLKVVVDTCHNSGVKAYLTTNVVVYEGEFETLKSLLLSAKDAGVDAVIVHDLGALKLARELGLDCHVSTQANITNSLSAGVYASLGASRVILSRELSLEQIRGVITNSPLPVECFVHGAMCVSISGRCFFSQALHGKNANRGECLQPCRREWRVISDAGDLVYDSTRFLNSKDLCMIAYIPELISAGISSFKIEGRMRDANYVSTVVSCYREAIDDFSESKVPFWLEKLGSVFNRGFCSGFYFGSPSESLDNAGNLSTVSKVLVGEVVNYFPKVGVAELKLSHDSLAVGDDFIIEGSSTFLKGVIGSLEVGNKPVSSSLKGSSVGLKVSERVRIGDLIHKLIKSRVV